VGVLATLEAVIEFPTNEQHLPRCLPGVQGILKNILSPKVWMREAELEHQSINHKDECTSLRLSLA
jgi:hypothetical protein